MKHTQRTLRRVGLVAGTSLLVLAAIGPAASPAFGAKPSGSIWTTNEDCAAPALQNDNSYLTGETVYVRGANFAANNAFSWTITGKPGGASGDPNQEVVNDGSTTDSAGAFCVAAYVIEADDWGEYSVEVEQGSTRKNDNYSVEPADEQAPEGGDDPTDPPADDPADPPADEETTPPSDETTPPADEETTPPADDPTDPPADEETTPPADEETTPPADETPTDEETTPPADDPTEPPADEETTPPSDETTPPTEDETTPPTEDETTPPAEETPSDETDPADGSETPAEDESEAPADTDTDTNAPTQEVLGVVSDGPTVTPPPTDTIVAPSDQGSGSEWRLIVTFLGILILAATIGLPERRRAS